MLKCTFLFCRFILPDQREPNDQSTHKWMVYVRGPSDHQRIDSFVSKVWFFLHPSYRPNDLVEVRSVRVKVLVEVGSGRVNVFVVIRSGRVNVLVEGRSVRVKSWWKLGQEGLRS